MYGPTNDPFDADPQLSEAFQQALIAASWRYRATHDTLRESVRAFVEALRRDGASLSEIVSTLQSLVADLRAMGVVAPAPATERDPLLEQLVSLCAEFGIRPG